jgi:hypothetical protein
MGGGEQMVQTTQIAAIGRVVVVKWGPNPTAQDVNRVLSEMRRVHGVLGRKTSYLAVVPRDAGNLTSDERSALMRLASAAQPCCDSMHVVFEGSGILKALQRSIVSGIMLMTGQRGYIYVHERVRDAIDAIDNLGVAEVTSLMTLFGAGATEPATAKLR